MKQFWFSEMTQDSTITMPRGLRKDLGLTPGTKLAWVVTEIGDAIRVELIPNVGIKHKEE